MDTRELRRLVRILVFLLLAPLLVSAEEKKPHQQGKLMPKGFHDVFLGMIRDDFLKKRPKLLPWVSEGRKPPMYFEKVTNNRFIDNVGYGFGDKGPPADTLNAIAFTKNFACDTERPLLTEFLAGCVKKWGKQHKTVLREEDKYSQNEVTKADVPILIWDHDHVKILVSYYSSPLASQLGDKRCMFGIQFFTSGEFERHRAGSLVKYKSAEGKPELFKEVRAAKDVTSPAFE